MLGAFQKIGNPGKWRILSLKGRLWWTNVWNTLWSRVYHSACLKRWWILLLVQLWRYNFYVFWEDQWNDRIIMTSSRETFLESISTARSGREKDTFKPKVQLVAGSTRRSNKGEDWVSKWDESIFLSLFRLILEILCSEVSKLGR